MYTKKVYQYSNKFYVHDMKISHVPATRLKWTRKKLGEILMTGHYSLHDHVCIELVSYEFDCSLSGI